MSKLEKGKTCVSGDTNIKTYIFIILLYNNKNIQVA